jgi:hypothetical protein
VPLILPAAAILPSPVLLTPDDTFSSARVTDYRFDLLDDSEQLIGTLSGVSGGDLSWRAQAAIKGGGSISVSETGQDVDWLNTRVRPVVILRDNVDGNSIEVPVGVYLGAAPVQDWNEFGLSMSVELLDKNCILDQDIVTDANGNPVTYSAPVGANVVTLVRNLIQMTGEATPAIEAGNKNLTKALTWDVGTPILKIINDLLAAADYFSLYTDGAGQFRVTPYTPATERAPVYRSEMPFSEGDQSLMSSSWTLDKDFYSVPNRYVAVSQGDGNAESMIAVVTNTDPTSPFSYQSRGRWITRTRTGVEAVSQADLMSRARQGMAGAMGITTKIAAEHMFLPEIQINRTVEFYNEAAGVNLICSVLGTTLPFNPTGLCKTDLREVSSVEIEEEGVMEE